jgi:hypothetical protein
LTSAFPAAGQQVDGQQAAEDPAAPAEEPPPAKPGVGARAWKAVREEARRYGRDSVALLRAPLHWQKNDWEKAGGAVLILGGLMLADRSIDNAAQRERSHFTDRVAGATTALGGQFGRGRPLEGMAHFRARVHGVPMKAPATTSLVKWTRLQGFAPGVAHGRFLVKRHNDEKAGVLSKADLEVVPIRRGLAARLRF